MHLSDDLVMSSNALMPCTRMIAYYNKYITWHGAFCKHMSHNKLPEALLLTYVSVLVAGVKKIT